MLNYVCEKLSNMRKFDLDTENMDKKSVCNYYAKCAVSGIVEGAILGCAAVGASTLVSVIDAKLKLKR